MIRSVCNGVLLQDAKGQRIEPGTQLRIDSTVTETDILELSDSRLLYDGVRVLTRLLRQGRERVATVSFRDHCRAAKRHEQEIRSARGARRRETIYRRLLSLGWQGRSPTRRQQWLTCAA